MFGFLNKKVNTASDIDTKGVHDHNIDEKQVEKACQLLAVYLASKPQDTMEVELRNLQCKEHGRIGSFKIEVTEI